MEDEGKYSGEELELLSILRKINDKELTPEEGLEAIKQFADTLKKD